MAVSNEVFILVTGIMFTYLVLYKKNRLLGNIAYIALGITTMNYSADIMVKIVGVLIFLGSIINTIYDLIVTDNTK